MKKISFFLLSFLILFPIEQLFAWGQEGHRIIGQIAYNHLSPKAKENIDQILGEKGVVYWANWADEIKSDTIYANSYNWHFQDLNGGMSDSALTATLVNYPQEGGNLFKVMDSLITVLRNEPDNFDALRFIIHLAGDKFCPMHMGHFDDLGGNKIKLQWFGRNSTLHKVWDSDLIYSRGYSYSEYAEYLEHRYHRIAQEIEKMSEAEILIQNYHITQEIYDYHKIWDGNSYHYIYHFTDTMEKQLYRSGIRLAKLLNELYG